MPRTFSIPTALGLRIEALHFTDVDGRPSLQEWIEALLAEKVTEYEAAAQAMSAGGIQIVPDPTMPDDQIRLVKYDERGNVEHEVVCINLEGELDDKATMTLHDVESGEEKLRLIQDLATGEFELKVPDD